MSATCRPDTAMSANFSRKGMSRRHKTCKKRPRHTQFIPITANKFKSAQTYEYPSYHRVFVFERHVGNHVGNPLTCRQMSCHLDTLNDMLCRRVGGMTKDMSPTCRDTTHHVCKWRLGKTWQIKTFPAKRIILEQARRDLLPPPRRRHGKMRLITHHKLTNVRPTQNAGMFSMDSNFCFSIWVHDRSHKAVTKSQVTKSPHLSGASIIYDVWWWTIVPWCSASSMMYGDGPSFLDVVSSSIPRYS